MTRAAELLVGSFVGTDGRMANSLVVSMGNGGGSGRQAATPAAHGERPAERGRRRRGDSSSRSPIFKTRARASGPAPPRPPFVQMKNTRGLSFRRHSDSVPAARANSFGCSVRRPLPLPIIDIAAEFTVFTV